MELLSASNPAWSNPEKSTIDVVATFDMTGPIPFTAHPTEGEFGPIIYANAVAGDYGPIVEYIAPPELTPEEKRVEMPSLTARQLRLGLLSLGKLDAVPFAIAALPSPEKEQAEIEWQFASEFRRLHPLIVKLIPILGLTDEQVDTVWLQFAQV